MKLLSISNMLSYRTLKTGLVLSFLAIAPTAGNDHNFACRCFPGDDCWPSVSTWNAFNQSIDGRLIKTVPLATPCHAPNYDGNKCETLKNGWLKTDEQYESTLCLFKSGTNKFQVTSRLHLSWLHFLPMGLAIHFIRFSNRVLSGTLFAIR